MDSSCAPENAGLSSQVFRPPLLPKAITSQQSTANHVRHQTSFFYKVDSSEEFPSPRESIYEAFSMSPNNSDELDSRIGSWSKVMLKAFSTAKVIRTQENNENSKQAAGSAAFMAKPTRPINDIEFRYGHGTPLETITEKKSSTTMSTLSRRRSADDIPIAPFLQHRDSFIVAKSPRRKKSFSVNDLSKVLSLYHDACATIETSKSPISEIYAQPKTPVQEPPERPETPPGMPSWTENQQSFSARRTSRGRTSRLRRIQKFLTFKHPQADILLRSSPRSGNTRNRSVPAPVFGNIAPRFRPPKSVYGPLDQHPFHGTLASATISSRRETVATAENLRTQANAITSRLIRKGKLDRRVRFTHSTTARDSENLALRTAVETTTTTAWHPLSTWQSAPKLSSNSRIDVQCPHRKGLIASLKNLKFCGSRDLRRLRGSPMAFSNSDCNHQSIAMFSPALSASSTRPATPTSSRVPDCSLPIYEQPLEASRTLSLTSNAPLMTGALSAHNAEIIRDARSSVGLLPSPESVEAEPVVKPCWACKVDRISGTLDKWWADNTNCLCFTCCGIDLSEDLSVASLNHGRTGGGSGVSMSGIWHNGMTGEVFTREETELRGPRIVNLQSRGAIKR